MRSRQLLSVILLVALTATACDPPWYPPGYRARMRHMNNRLDDALKEAQQGNIDEARDKAGTALMWKYVLLENMPTLLGVKYEEWYEVISQLCGALDAIEAHGPPPKDPAAYNDWLEELREYLEAAKSAKEQIEQWVRRIYDGLPRPGGIPGPGGLVIVLQDALQQLAEMNEILTGLIEEVSREGGDPTRVYQAVKELRGLKRESLDAFRAPKDMNLVDWAEGMRDLDIALDSIISFQANDPPTDEQKRELERLIQAAKDAKKVVE